MNSVTMQRDLFVLDADGAIMLWAPLSAATITTRDEMTRYMTVKFTNDD